MKTSEIYSRAKALLWDGKTPLTDTCSRYICDVITHNPGLNPLLTQREADAATDFIHKLLGPNEYSLRTWLIKHRHATATEIENNQVKMQATRVAFLDHLIEHFKSKGD